ncbi:MAG TPA: xanthine dehydrogenase family protein molybdopterin-binding subunit [Solirubrobacteraceae bacterium]|nr:xanthine dehydrogenase family protein molybdopterin-binding subunit [Solirubrobacteraceae bacterium]
MSAPTEPRTGGNGYIGRSMRRKEDPRLITGKSRYTDDIVLAGTLYAAIIRSPEAHARIVSIDAGAAQARDDVRLVLTGEDLADLQAPLPMAWAPPGVEMNTPEHWPLARGKVCCVGDPVAVVVGEDKYAVIDAAEDVIVEYESLPVVTDPEAALGEGSPVIHEAIGHNRSHEWGLGSEDVEERLAAADVVVERRIVNHRTSGAAIEPRAVIGDWRADELTLYSSTQIPHLLRSFLAGELGVSEERVRVIAPEVGGGFGSKLQQYGEETLMAYCSRRLERPVKWVATRTDDMAASHHGRDQIDYVRMGLDREGRILALHAKLIADLGAYHMLLTPFIPSFGAFVMSGCYAIPSVRTDIVGAFTNKMATDAVRGAGRPEATHLIELVIDQAAAELGMDPLELRRRNFIPKEDFPAEVAVGMVYDSGNYAGALDRLMERFDLAAFRREQEELRGRGIYRGVGFSAYVEMCGLAPSRAVGPKGVGLQAGFWESAVVRVHPSGSATVFTGTSPHGQGHETSFAQIVADKIGIPAEQVEIVHGDTGTGPYGMGTYGSRALAVGGESIARTADKIADKAKRIVAHMLEAAPEDIELADGRYRVRGSPDKGMSVAEVAGAAYIPEDLPNGMEPGLEETTFFDPENFVWPFGVHACVVDVDPETGKTKVMRYVCVDDCGTAINPMLIEGQVHGGVVHAIGQVLYEQIAYDGEGNLLTSTFTDYALPTAAEVPSFETGRTETPSPVNSLGVKGVGEAGTIGATPAVVNAVIDALRPLGVDFLNMPLSPMRVWRAIEEARA